MIPDPATEAAAHELARCDAELAEATAIQATAQAHDSHIRGQIKTLEAERQAIVTRRAACDQHPTDGAKLAELAADIEGLGFMVPEANAGLTEANRAVSERTSARQQAGANLSRAEKANISSHRNARLDELASIMLALVERDNVQRRLTGEQPNWVAPPALLQDLRQRAAQRPDLATGGMPGSRFPASAAYRPALRAV
jgi:chromosome segregation ATPase